MIARLRKLRWLAALMLIASPAVGGQLMPVLHPCAVQTSPDNQHAGHGAGHDTAPDGAQCSCIGSCQAPGLVSEPRPDVVIATAAVLPAAPLRVVDTATIIAIDRPIDRLPPPTAPPIA